MVVAMDGHDTVDACLVPKLDASSLSRLLCVSAPARAFRIPGTGGIHRSG